MCAKTTFGAKWVGRNDAACSAGHKRNRHPCCCCCYIIVARDAGPFARMFTFYAYLTYPSAQWDKMHKRFSLCSMLLILSEGEVITTQETAAGEHDKHPKINAVTSTPDEDFAFLSSCLVTIAMLSLDARARLRFCPPLHRTCEGATPIRSLLRA